jgi:hypothetical protein
MDKMLKRSLVLIGVSTWLAPALGHARECLGVSFPEQVQVAGTSLALNGLGLRQATLFKVNVYVAALYVPKPTADASVILAAATPYEMQLHFVRNVGAADIAKGWVEGFQRNGQGAQGSSDERVATLRGWMTDIKSGESMIFLFQPGTGLVVRVNGSVKGTIPGDDFGRTFLSIWLGVPPNPEIKVGLLGGRCDRQADH